MNLLYIKYKNKKKRKKIMSNLVRKNRVSQKRKNEIINEIILKINKFNESNNKSSKKTDRFLDELTETINNNFTSTEIEKYNLFIGWDVLEDLFIFENYLVKANEKQVKVTKKTKKTKTTKKSKTTKKVTTKKVTKKTKKVEKVDNGRVDNNTTTQILINDRPSAVCKEIEQIEQVEEIVEIKKPKSTNLEKYRLIRRILKTIEHATFFTDDFDYNNFMDETDYLINKTFSDKEIKKYNLHVGWENVMETDDTLDWDYEKRVEKYTKYLIENPI